MASKGFVSGNGNSVVLRPGRDGWVWGFKAACAGAPPAPSAFFVPFSDYDSASQQARQWAMAGWRVWVRRARRCTSATFEVKVALPMGWSASSARSALQGVC
jgi:hypothetical protein